MRVPKIETFVNRSRLSEGFDESLSYNVEPKIETRVKIERYKDDKTGNTFEYGLNLNVEMIFPKEIRFVFSAWDMIYIDNKAIIPTADELMAFWIDSIKRTAELLNNEIHDKKIRIAKPVNTEFTPDEVRKKIQKAIDHLSQK